MTGTMTETGHVFSYQITHRKNKKETRRKPTSLFSLFVLFAYVPPEKLRFMQGQNQRNYSKLYGLLTFERKEKRKKEFSTNDYSAQRKEKQACYAMCRRKNETSKNQHDTTGYHKNIDQAKWKSQ